MIRRSKRTLPSLSKSISRLSLIGGDGDYTQSCLGFEQGEQGLTICPAPMIRNLSTQSTRYMIGVKNCGYKGLTMLFFSDGLVLFMDRNCLFTLLTKFGPGNPFAVEARSEVGEPLILAVCGKYGLLYNLTTEEKTTFPLPVPMDKGIMHCGRLFAVNLENKYMVVWSGLRVTDWTEGIDGSGSIILDSDLGEILTLENFGDDILCVREWGFTVIKAMADSRNFRISPAQCSIRTPEKVNVGAVFGQKYYFATSLGVYSFDGTSVKLEYTDINARQFGKAYAYGDGYVYLECYYTGSMCLMRYNPLNGQAVYFGPGCSMPFVVNGLLFCSYDDRIQVLTVLNSQTQGVWRSKPIGGGGRKTLKNLWVDAADNPIVRVNCDNTTSVYRQKGRIPVNLTGEKITVEITSSGSVKSIEAELEVRR